MQCLPKHRIIFDAAHPPKAEDVHVAFMYRRMCCGRNHERREDKATLVHFKVITRHSLGRIWKTTKDFRQVSWYPGRVSNWVPFEGRSSTFLPWATTFLKRTVFFATVSDPF
jgi:hypothetical protein